MNVNSNPQTSALMPRVGFQLVIIALAVVCTFSGCNLTRSFFLAPLEIGRENSVRSGLASRVKLNTPLSRQPGENVIPMGLDADIPIGLDSAIQTALANNDAFHATLAQIGMAEGDLLKASQLTNPSLSTMIPSGVKQWEWTLFLPIEAFLLRPEKMELAEKDCERIAHQLVQNGMQLVRDVTIAYTNLGLATEQHQLALETLTIRRDLADLTEQQLKDGDIAELEAIQTRVDALNAKANATLLEQDVEIAREQLALLMGIPDYARHLVVPLVPHCHLPDDDLETLISQAIANRPDLQAAQWAIEAAETRYRLAQKAWWRFDGIADYNGSGDQGPETGPGIFFNIPIFNKNEGGVARACAEFEAARYNRDQIQDQIVQQIRLASAQAQQASDNFNTLNSEVLPTLAEAMVIAKQGFVEGGTSYLLVLQTTSQYVDVKSRILNQAAALCRASAELEFSCGGRLRTTIPLSSINAINENQAPR